MKSLWSWQSSQDTHRKQDWSRRRPLPSEIVEAGKQKVADREDTGTRKICTITIMDFSICTLEFLGVFFSAVAWLASLTTTLMSTWLTLSTELLATETFQLGLWETCVVQELGGLECRPYNSILGLPQNILLARTLMCVSLAVGLLGFLLAIPGLHLVNSCHSQVEEFNYKRCLKMLGGVLCLVAGVLGLIPVSYFAHVAVMQFFDETLPEMIPRWEFGDALFCGWTAGLIYLLAGTLLLISSFLLPKDTKHQNRNLPVPSLVMGVQLGIPNMKTRSEYV